MTRRAAGLTALLVAVALVAVRLFEPSLHGETGGPGDGRLPVVAVGDSNTADVEIDSAALTQHQTVEFAFRGLPIPGCEEFVKKRDERLVRFNNEELARQTVESLRASDDVDLILAAALLEGEASAREGLFGYASTLDPDNPLIRWSQLQACANSDTECDRIAVEAAAIASDGTNGLVWFEIARRYIQSQNWSDAQVALQHATSATRFDFYFIEHALAVERGLAATSDLSYAERVVYGIGISAALSVPSFGDVTRACSPEPEKARIDVTTCLQLGEHMAESSRDLLTTMIGYSIWRNSAQRAEDVALAEQIDREKEELYASVLHEQAATGAMALMQNDSGVLQRYIDNFLAHGEIRASEMLVEEAKRLRQDASYDQCNFVGETDFSP